MEKLTHDIVKKGLLSNAAVKEEYDRLMENYDIVSTLIKARKRAHKTQEQVAEFMKTTASVVSRIESGGGKDQHSPSLITLRKYAAAVGCRLEIKLTPVHSHLSR